MAKKICFWCDNVIEEKGETLCKKCREKYIKGKEELVEIEREYKKLFGHLDCKGMIKLFKERSREIVDLKAEKERIKKNWMISRTQQRRLYDNLKNQYKQAGVVCYPIVLDGCRIVNEEQLLDFAKDMVLEKEEWKQEKKDLIIELKALNVDFNWQKARIKNLEKELNG